MPSTGPVDNVDRSKSFNIPTIDVVRSTCGSGFLIRIRIPCGIGVVDCESAIRAKPFRIIDHLAPLVPLVFFLIGSTGVINQSDQQTLALERSLYLHYKSLGWNIIRLRAHIPSLIWLVESLQAWVETRMQTRHNKFRDE